MGAPMKYLDLLLTYDEVMQAQNDTIVRNENFPAPVYGIRFACGRKIYFEEPRSLPKEISLRKVLG
jgi:hypothetical protein